jgi:hypothetical protein
MKRFAFMWIALTRVLLAPTAGFARILCSREGLQRAVDLYITAQIGGDTSGLGRFVRVDSLLVKG